MMNDDDRTYLCAGCGGLGRRAEMYSDDPPVCSWGCAAEAFEIDDLDQGRRQPERIRDMMSRRYLIRTGWIPVTGGEPRWHPWQGSWWGGGFRTYEAAQRVAEDMVSSPMLDVYEIREVYHAAR